MSQKESTILNNLAGAHFIGVGGVGMSAIATILAARGVAVSGSDQADGPVVARLRQAGVTVHIGHRAENIAQARSVVISTAIRPDNPELRAAVEQGLPVLHRSQALGALMRLGRSIGVAGAHGKTTTTLMVAETLTAGDCDPTVLVGGWVDAWQGGARVGRTDHIVAEVDESDRSLLNVQPDVCVVTNIDFDHPDHFRDYEHVIETFCDFFDRLPEESVLIMDGDDPGVRRVAGRTGRRTLLVSLEDRQADVFCAVTAANTDGSTFDLRFQGRDVGSVHLPAPGIHNVRNGAAALAAAIVEGVAPEDAVAGLAAFRGVRRRFDLRGEAGGVRVYDDYAHHPREIQATLAVARALADQRGGRVFAIFQPHRYTRTQALARDFGLAFGQADWALIMDVYAAGDDPIAGVDGGLLVAHARAGGHGEALRCPDFDDVLREAQLRLRPGDIALTMGAGDITHFGPKLLEALRHQDADHDKAKG